jgi:putative Ca2+/H+ antiporter (TMEM165/GDT1 family)
MEWKTFATVFLTVFVAEIGDKTQLATLLFSADRSAARWAVFAGSALALTAAAAIAVLLGAQLERLVSPKTLRTVAGVGFLSIGAWTLLSK